ncbi:Dpc13p SCDLUD_001441 [Saccharomycodes ludwigii]|uniref:Dpc13p n=1 Tax=Saccharomycodes ludwigii TaxID=36035 RepID=UPI001E8A3D53|nr:hypothetical protein SCDLUD_001441 [Saccharomycodes ludwigii]KAH3901671.1 hypothetical protein SCDLUD_001441 [Saccharomycodes ludwigii]
MFVPTVSFIARKSLLKQQKPLFHTIILAKKLCYPAPIYTVAKSSTNRFYATSPSTFNSKESDELEKVQELMDKIYSNPSVLEKLNEISAIMVEKKYINPDSGSMSPWSMIKVIMDKQVKGAMVELREEMQKCGINIGQDQIGALMSVLGMNGKNTSNNKE